MQPVAHALPSYWLAELGRYPFLPGRGVPLDRRLGAAGLVRGADGAGCAGLSSGCGHQQALSPAEEPAGGCDGTPSRLFRPAPFDDCEDPDTAPGAYRGPTRRRPGPAPGAAELAVDLLLRPGLPGLRDPDPPTAPSRRSVIAGRGVLVLIVRRLPVRGLGGRRVSRAALALRRRFRRHARRRPAPSGAGVRQLGRVRRHLDRRADPLAAVPVRHPGLGHCSWSSPLIGAGRRSSSP